MVNSARGLPLYYAGNDLGSHWLTFDLPFGQSTRNIWYSTMIPRKISSTGRVLIPFLGWLYIVIPWEPPSFSHDSKIIEPTSLDWFTGKFPGTPYIFMGKPWFPVDCTFNQWSQISNSKVCRRPSQIWPMRVSCTQDARCIRQGVPSRHLQAPIKRGKSPKVMGISILPHCSRYQVQEL